MKRCYIVVTLLALVGVGCLSPSVQWFKPTTVKPTLGEMVHTLVTDNLDSESICIGQRRDYLQSQRETFVTHIDESLSADFLRSVGTTLQESLLPLIDEGRLVALSDDLAAALGLLVDDTADPDSLRLRSLLPLLGEAANLPLGHLTRLIERNVEAPQALGSVDRLLELLTHGASGQTWFSQLLNLLNKAPLYSSHAASCGSIAWPDFSSTWLREDLYPSTTPPAWTLRLDDQGYPHIAPNPVTGLLPAPVSDLNQDGNPDRNEKGLLVGADGFELRLQPFGTGPGYDAWGRAVDATGWPIFTVFDAKKTPLATLLLYVHKALQATMADDLIALVQAMHRTGASCTLGDVACWATLENPLADLGFWAIELLSAPSLPSLMHEWLQFTEQHPEDTEAMILLVGDIVHTIASSDQDLVVDHVLELMLDMMPLVADLLTTENAGLSPLALSLTSVAGKIAQEESHVSDALALSVRYQHLVKEDACGEAGFNLSASTPVDFRAPRFISSAGGAALDNRSGLEQSLELFSAMDCGIVPLSGGKSVAELLVATIAQADSATLCDIVDTSFGVLALAPGTSDILGSAALDLIGCQGNQVWPQLMSLDVLAKSGALNAFLPIVQTFVEQEQETLLMDMLHFLAADLQQDENSSSSPSALRQSLPVLLELLERGVVDDALVHLSRLKAVPTTDTPYNLADLTLTLLSDLSQRKPILEGRQTTLVNSSIASEFLRSLLNVAQRLQQQEQAPAVSRIFDHALSYLAHGSPDAISGSATLADQRLLPLFSTSLSTGLSFVQSPAGGCHRVAMQDTLSQWFEGSSWSDLTSLLTTWMSYPHKKELENFFIGSLAPEQLSLSHDRLGAGLQWLSAYLATPESSLPTQAVLTSMVDMLMATDTDQWPQTLRLVLAQEEQGLVWQLILTFLDHGVDDQHESPFDFFGSLAFNFSTMDDWPSCGPAPMTLRLQDTQALIKTTLHFINDPKGGLPALYTLLKERQKS
jgi:hypothetical protein